MASDLEQLHELSYYTLAHPDPSFLHQNIVDAYAAQHADEASKPIQVVFALVGLYLCVEKEFTGKQAQKAHMQLARQRRQWVLPLLPEDRGDVGVADVLAAAPGEARDAMIGAWCVSVWESWKGSRQQIVELVRKELGVE